MSAFPLSGSRTTTARSSRALVVASAATVTLAAWLWLGGASASHAVHSGLLAPHLHQPDASSFAYTLVMWQAMMLAMMTPAFLRWMLTFARLTGGSKGAARLGPVVTLATGYFVVWLAYSLGGAMIQLALQRIGVLAEGRLVAGWGGVVLIAAGLFQFAPFKRACLTHCRNPLTYLLSRWRGGSSGGFRLGLSHGAYCVGCCWVLMLTGLAMGVMNLAWMAVLTLAIAAEQVLPHGDRVARAAGVVIAGWGLALLV